MKDKGERKIILIGGGGHCHSCIDVIEQIPTTQIVGILDPSFPKDSLILKYRVLGGDELIATLTEQGYQFLISVGMVGKADLRLKLFQHCQTLGATLETLVAPSAYFSPYASVEAGTIVMHKACLNAKASVGKNCIINSLALIEHDAIIGAHSHIATSCVINGNCRIGQACFIGSGSVVLQGISIGDNIIVGAGSLVTNDLTEAGIYWGSPAKFVKPLKS